jgi:50S ribosomal subunit-associated GTPase HflX
VEAVLGELGLADRPTILAYNKIDRLGQRPDFPWGPGSGRVAISAKTGAGLDDLRREIVAGLDGPRPTTTTAPRSPDRERSEALC